VNGTLMPPDSQRRLDGEPRREAGLTAAPAADGRLLFRHRQSVSALTLAGHSGQTTECQVVAEADRLLVSRHPGKADNAVRTQERQRRLDSYDLQ
jgi:hypothetical protein